MNISKEGVSPNTIVSMNFICTSRQSPAPKYQRELVRSLAIDERTDSCSLLQIQSQL